MRDEPTEWIIIKHWPIWGIRKGESVLLETVFGFYEDAYERTKELMRADRTIDMAWIPPEEFG